MNIYNLEFCNASGLANSRSLRIRFRRKTLSRPISKRGAETARHWAAVLTITQCRHNVSACDGGIPASHRFRRERVPVRVPLNLSVNATPTTFTLHLNIPPHVRLADAVALPSATHLNSTDRQRRPVRLLLQKAFIFGSQDGACRAVASHALPPKSPILIHLHFSGQAWSRLVQHFLRKKMSFTKQTHFHCGHSLNHQPNK